jgi:hypothetical protein
VQKFVELNPPEGEFCSKDDPIFVGYFQPHWDEFRRWWHADCGERIERSFCVPHNLNYFWAWVFTKYPAVRAQVEQDFADLDATNSEGTK